MQLSLADQHNEGDKVQAAPMKKEKLSFEEEDLRESVGISRPRRQASCVSQLFPCILYILIGWLKLLYFRRLNQRFSTP